MIKNKDKLLEQLKILECEYLKLYKEDCDLSKKEEVNRTKRHNAIIKLDIKINKLKDDIYKIDDEILKNTHPKETVDSAKIILEECGYKVIRI